MFGMFKGKAKEAVNQFSGNKDFLEGLCGACALVAAADGSISDSEIDSALASIKASSSISAAFSPTEIEAVFGKMATKVGNRLGRMGLKTEIQEAVTRDKTGQMGLAIVLAAVEVADEGGKGSIDDKEMVVLKEIAGMCGQNLEKLIAA